MISQVTILKIMYQIKNLSKPRFGDLTDMNGEVQFCFFFSGDVISGGWMKGSFFTDIDKGMIKDDIPVVPHKAVAEVSRRGKL